MAITTYAELQTAVDNWTDRTNTNARILEWIALAEADINRRLKVREQEATADLTVNAQTVALPTGFIGVRRLYLSASPLIKPEYMTPERFWETFVDGTSARPTNYTIEGDNLVFGPSPAETYTGKILYWKRQDISASAHALFNRNPDLYLYGTLAQAEPFYGNDPRMATWKALYEKILGDVERCDKRDRFPSSAAVKPHVTTR